MSAQAKKIKVPAVAPTVLVTLNTKILALRQELGAIVEAGRAYAKGVRLDPTKDYRFIVEGDKVYAIEIVKEGAEQKE